MFALTRKRREMEKIVEQGLLYDFYGALLTGHQKSVYELLVYENMSLSEIAAEQGISRQAVHDIIKRCDKTLKDYEDKLHLIEKFLSIKKDVERIEVVAGDDDVKLLAHKILESL